LAPPAEKRRGAEAEPNPPFSGISRRRVKPRTARNGDALEHALPAFLHEFLHFLKQFLCNSWSFEDCFVKFGLFDVIFIYFLNIIICIVDVKRKEKNKKEEKNKKKRKNIVKKCMCVLECCFYGYIFFLG
jgi:hypothetical protein